MNSYVALLRTPGVARIIAAQLTARFPSGMISLGFLLHMESIFDSYAAAGIVLAATSIGQAVSGPLTSRLMGVLGMRVQHQHHGHGGGDVELELVAKFYQHAS